MAQARTAAVMDDRLAPARVAFAAVFVLV